MSLASRSLGTIALVAIGAPALAQDLVVPGGSTVVYDTTAGPLRVDNLIVESGGKLVAAGPEALRLYARHSIVLEGAIDLSGVSNPGVLTLNTTNIPELGAAGGPGGGAGGLASRFTNKSTPDGFPGLGSGPQSRGGKGGETSFHPVSKDARRGAGGGGGAFTADQPVSNVPHDPANLGLIASAGEPGGLDGTGALSGNARAVGGGVGPRPFQDADPSNDFFGRQRDASGAIIVGELAAPIGGRGGGAGGDAVRYNSFPQVPFTPTGDEKGSGGGGGGGLAILQAPLISVGPGGGVVANGGDGGGGENTLFFDRVGGGSGGGSGGMILMQARLVDLSQASADALSALGGRGGPGKDNVFGDVGAGGNGGPGLIQIHVPRGAADILLPGGVALEELTTPNAIVLLPEPGL